MGLRRRLNLKLVITNEAQGFHSAEERLFMRKRAGESFEHVLMKLLSYILFYHPELAIEEPVGQRHKPDLVRVDERGVVLQWIDCGATSLRKLERITHDNTQTLIDIVKPTEKELRSYKEQADRRLSNPERVRYTTFEPHLLDELAQLLHRRHTVLASVPPSGDHIYLSINGRPLSGAVIRL
jgi:uncharacterized protein YaeQ